MAGEPKEPRVRSILETVDVATGERTELARFDYLIEAPNWTRFGKLVYNSGGRLFAFDLGTRESQPIDTGFAVHCNNDHVLSPDHSHIAVSHHTKEDGQSRIYVLPLHLGEANTLATASPPVAPVASPVPPAPTQSLASPPVAPVAETSTSAPAASTPVPVPAPAPAPSITPTLITPLAPSYLHGWSPDGTTLAYCAERSGEYDIYTIPAVGGLETQLTDAPGLNDGPEYSPDGAHIWFNSVRTGLMQVWRMEADGGNQTQMTFDESNNWFPHVSPDGRQVAFLAYRKGDVEPGAHPANKNVEIRVMSSEGGESQHLVSLFGGQGTINVNSWSPDSKQLAFVSYEVVS